MEVLDALIDFYFKPNFSLITTYTLFPDDKVKGPWMHGVSIAATAIILLLSNKLARVQRQLLQDLGREPTPEELAAELDMTPEKVVEVQKYGREPISLSTPLGEDGDSEFGDLIEDTEAVVPADAVGFTMLQQELERVLESLHPREAGVIKSRFGLGDGVQMTLDQIGEKFGVTRERIRQIESKTMSKLRHPSRSQLLRDYLDN